ncbi:MAG: TonB-dependent receptor plug domain-containing protein, partial [Acidobacteria bacterium]|nr:TonB-dependent receptor plug domain-containing protein [Acidobacteriota bacterium]
MENLPLNGRQFANLAATIPGVGLGFHSDPTKSTQYSPQINGGNGRNVNYQMDGGDNNDDTVGGLLQLFPLEAIQEFNVQTARYKAEYGRSNGGVMNIVTKSGTNDMSGSLFTLFRDTEMNARTETEKFNEVEKQDYRRYQYGGSFGGPIARDRVHYFAAAERTQQDTFQ